MKPIRQAIFNVQKEMRLNGDSKELQHVLDLLCKIEKGEKINFAHSCEKLVFDEGKKMYEKGWEDGANHIYTECMPRNKN